MHYYSIPVVARKNHVIRRAIPVKGLKCEIFDHLDSRNFTPQIPSGKAVRDWDFFIPQKRDIFVLFAYKTINNLLAYSKPTATSC